MEKIKALLLTAMILLAPFALMACNEECTHANLTITGTSNGQHTIACDTCDYQTAEKCSGGTATCQKGAICDKCHAEYTAADTNAHTFVSGSCTVEGCGAVCSHTFANGACTVEGCGVTCDHAGKLSTTTVGNAQHKTACSVCDYAITEDCSGGTASCQRGKICENCHTEYTAKDPNAHNWNAETGECDVTGCGAVCSHNYTVSDNNIDDSLHAKTCSICRHITTESCSGGSATCEARAICEKCGAAHGELVPINTKYKYVVVIGVDGAGTFFRNTDTPNIDKIFANGAVSYDVLTSNPKISAQSWGSLMHGVTPSFHGLTNSIVASTPYDPKSEFPSFFRVIRNNDQNAVLASFSHWNPIYVGIVEDGIDVYKRGGMSDAELTAEILTYL